jgi:autotransporter family porin
VPGDLSLPDWPDYWNPRVNSEFVTRIDGKYTGTTDEILSWGACKWGFDTDLIRAMATEESYWHQDQLGDYSHNPDDCVGPYQVPCPTSFGILQIKHIYRPGSYPYSQQYTAFNVDYALAVLRGCFEGFVTYLGGDYAPGDLWGCVGWHYSGDWKDPSARGYISRVKGHLDRKPWQGWPSG